MTSVESAAQLAAIIATRLGDIRRNTRPKAVTGHHTSNDRTDSGTEAPASGDEIAQLIAQRVGALAADVPDREHRVFRIFLEAVLAREFGTELLGDPEFDALIDEAQRRMSQDARLQEAMREAATRLLAGSVPPGKPSAF